MISVLSISGPNLQLLGTREPEIYGPTTLEEIHARLHDYGRSLQVNVTTRQSNHEGEIVSWIGEARVSGFAGLLVNAGAYTHTSVAILDALRASQLPTVEVHLSNPHAREDFRHLSYVAHAAVGVVAGFGPDSYLLALDGLVRTIRRSEEVSSPRKRTQTKVPEKPRRRARS